MAGTQTKSGTQYSGEGRLSGLPLPAAYQRGSCRGWLNRLPASLLWVAATHSPLVAILQMQDSLGWFGSMMNRTLKAEETPLVP